MTNFRGLKVEILSCTQCGKAHRGIFESFVDIKVSIMDVNKCNLIECMIKQFKSEIDTEVKIKCSACKNDQIIR